jgi:hypothetical protein
MFSLFQNRHPLAILFLIPLAAVFTFLHFWFSKEEMHTINLPFFQKVFTLQKQELAVVFFGLLALNSMALSKLFNRLNLIDFFSYIPGLLYLIFSFSSLTLDQTHVLFAEFFVILGVVFVLRIKNNFDAKASVFLAAFFFAIAIAAFPGFLFIVFVPFIALARSKSFVFREYFLAFLAYCLVAFYVMFYYYFYELRFSFPWVMNAEFVAPNYDSLGLFIGGMLLLLLSVLTRSRTVGSPGIRIERIVVLMFIAVVLQLISSLFFFTIKTETDWYASVFLALYVGYAYHFTNVKFVYHMLSYAILVFAILQHFGLF